ncbi:hypothetical protein FRB97_002593 [Tulasnella sp. 331]|nr:hypothetical protein FRB97_002593 [Tulasnella sp. 331]
MPLPAASRRANRSKDDRLLLDVLLSNKTSQGHSAKPTLVLLEYDLSSSPWPIVRRLLQESRRTVVLALTGTRKDLFGNRDAGRTSDSDTFLDWTEHVPDFEVSVENGASWEDPRPAFREALEQATSSSKVSEPLTALIDSVDTLVDDLGSISIAQRFLSDSLRSLSRVSGSRLVLPIRSSSTLLHLVLPISFSQDLTHLTIHSPQRVRRVREMYMVTPGSDEARFWKLFHGPDMGNLLDDRDWTEGVVKLFVRSGVGKGSGIKTTLEAWTLGEDGAAQACHWDELSSLKGLSNPGPGGGLFKPGSGVKKMGGSLDTLSFNLSLTQSQQEAKSQVSLPYVHQGQEANGSVIHYDPDSADDMDDEDPDEDLDL